MRCVSDSRPDTTHYASHEPILSADKIATLFSSLDSTLSSLVTFFRFSCLLDYVRGYVKHILGLFVCGTGVVGAGRSMAPDAFFFRFFLYSVPLLFFLLRLWDTSPRLLICVYCWKERRDRDVGSWRCVQGHDCTEARIRPRRNGPSISFIGNSNGVGIVCLELLLLFFSSFFKEVYRTMYIVVDLTRSAVTGL